MKRKAVLARGTTVQTREYALEGGLNVSNTVFSQFAIGQASSETPPGLYFWKISFLHPNPVVDAEERAKVGAQLLQDGSTPMVVKLEITESNFPLLQSRLRIVVGDEFKEVRNLKDLIKDNDIAVTLNLDKMAHEDLIAAGVELGFLEGEQFVYKAYEKWSADIGKRALTREELALRDVGQNPFYRR